MNEWQPIETAPKDGTEILLCESDSVYLGGWFGDKSHSWCPQVIERENSWVSDGGEILFPSHWMPLPKPPISCVHEEWGIWLDTSTNEKHFIVDFPKKTAFKYCPNCGVKAGDMDD